MPVLFAGLRTKRFTESQVQPALGRAGNAVRVVRAVLLGWEALGST